jgi:alpha-N-arabinofuranosidase
MILTPTYHVMKMYNVHQDATLLPTEIFDEVKYSHNGKSLPAISCSASRNAAGKIHVSLVNIDANKSNSVTLKLRGTKAGKVNGTILKSGKLQDYNGFDGPEAVKPTVFKDFELKGENLQVTLPPFSVVVLSVE